MLLLKKEKRAPVNGRYLIMIFKNLKEIVYLLLGIHRGTNFQVKNRWQKSRKTYNTSKPLFLLAKSLYVDTNIGFCLKGDVFIERQSVLVLRGRP